MQIVLPLAFVCIVSSVFWNAYSAYAIYVIIHKLIRMGLVWYT
jgi:hypothetical protein